MQILLFVYRGMSKKSRKIGSTGEHVVGFYDKKKECLGCAQCAIMCPDLAIVSVVKQ